MQTPKTRNNPDMAHKTSTAPRVVRQLKIASDTDSVCSSNSASGPLTDRSPKITERRSPRGSTSELRKKRPSRVSELESQISHLKEDLEKAKEQLTSSESSREKLQQETEETKKKLAAVIAKLDKSQHRLIDFSASEELRKKRPSRVSELESQISHLKEGLEKAKEQLTSSESSREKLQQETEETKKKLAAVIAKLDKSQHRLIDFSASEEVQVLGLHKGESEHAAIQNEQSTESSSVAAANVESKQNEDARDIHQAYKKELSNALILVDDLGDQLNRCRESEEQARSLSVETFINLQAVNATIGTLKLEGLNCPDSLNSIHAQLHKARAKAKSLQEHVSNIHFQKSMIQVDGKNPTDVEHRLEDEIDIVKQEVVQLRFCIEETDTRLCEAEVESTMKIQTVYEAVKTLELESKSCVAREMEMVSTMKVVGSELGKLQQQLPELKKNLMNREKELQNMEENEMLKGYIRDRDQEESLVDVSKVQAKFETAKAREQEALLKLESAIGEKEKSVKKAARLEELLEVAQTSNAAMEAELKRLEVQMEQWKKAADAATALLSTTHYGMTVARTGSLDSTAYSNIRVELPFYDMDESLPRKKNPVLKRLGELLKKKSHPK